MKSFLFLAFIFLVSCLPMSRDLKTVTYPIPTGKKVLLIHLSPPVFSDFYLEEREVSLRILEELEESGYSVVLGEKVWEDLTVISIPSDHLQVFQNGLRENSIEEMPRIQTWKDRAERIGASDIFLLRYSFSSDSKTKPIRMFWINLTKKEMIRFDWNWNPENQFPFRDSVREILRGKNEI